MLKIRLTKTKVKSQDKTLKWKKQKKKLNYGLHFK